jgi:hypothetical protein
LYIEFALDLSITNVLGTNNIIQLLPDIFVNSRQVITSVLPFGVMIVGIEKFLLMLSVFVTMKPVNLFQALFNFMNAAKAALSITIVTVEPLGM